MEEPEIPEIIEEGTNPGWRIRIGDSKRAAEVLLEASDRGIWFDSEEEMDEYVQRKLASHSSNEEGN